jgi:hypothetical protein
MSDSGDVIDSNATADTKSRETGAETGKPGVKEDAAASARRQPQGSDTMWLLAADRALPSDTSAPSAARRWVARQLATTNLFPPGPDDVGECAGRSELFDVLLCTSELVNVSLIAESTMMTLRLRVQDRRVRIALLDDCGHVSDAHDGRTHAQLFALRIFDSLADDWGIDPVAGGGRTIWVELSFG